MSPVKEPFYFAFEGEPPLYPGAGGAFFRKNAIWRSHEYAGLFAGVRHERAVGEASATYLASPQAGGRIHKNLPASRIVAVLRQPAERAYSGYTFLSQFGFEPAPTFEEALALEESRLKTGWIPILGYKSFGCYHAQLSVYYDLFPPEQIRVYLYEDWKNDPQTMLRDLFQFLEVEDGFAPDICHSNITLLPRNRRMHRLARHPERLERCAPFLPSGARQAASAALRWMDRRFNLAPPPRLAPEVRARLTAGFREDILRLQDLIGRDLSHWLNPV